MIDIVPLFILGIFVLDSLMVIESGILKGINKAGFVSATTLIIYYFFGIPLILWLSEPWGLNLKILGLWLNNGITNLMLTLIFAYKLLTINWKT